jgi:hypothetical protein
VEETIHHFLDRVHDRARDGSPDVELSYRVVAKRRGFERDRMPLAVKAR